MEAAPEHRFPFAKCNENRKPSGKKKTNMGGKHLHQVQYDYLEFPLTCICLNLKHFFFQSGCQLCLNIYPVFLFIQLYVCNVHVKPKAHHLQEHVPKLMHILQAGGGVELGFDCLIRMEKVTQTYSPKWWYPSGHYWYHPRWYIDIDQPPRTSNQP